MPQAQDQWVLTLVSPGPEKCSMAAQGSEQHASAQQPVGCAISRDTGRDRPGRPIADGRDPAVGLQHSVALEAVNDRCVPPAPS